MERYAKRIELGDGHAAFNLALCYIKQDGTIFEKDLRKYFDHLLQAVELGSPDAMTYLAVEYKGSGHASAQEDLVNRNVEKRRFCLEAAARGGDYCAHSNLGDIERFTNGNNDLAVKHYHVAAAAGFKYALDRIRDMHKDGKASKEEFLKAILPYQDASAEHSTDERKKWEEKMKKAQEEKKQKPESAKG